MTITDNGKGFDTNHLFSGNGMSSLKKRAAELNGECKINPIHGADLAEICTRAIQATDKELIVGGPQIFTYNQIAQLAFAITGNKIKITHIPSVVARSILWLLRTFTSSKVYGPIEFFMTVLTTNLITRQYGSHTLEQYFKELQ